MKKILSISFLLLLVTTLKAQFFIGTGQEVHVVNSALLYTGENVSGSGLMNVNLSTAESKGSISGISINAVNGTMVMSGTTDQVVNGGLYVDNSINRLFNSNTTSITIDGKVVVMDTLFMSTTGAPLVKMPTGDTLLLDAVVKNGGEFQLNGGVLHLNPTALNYSCSTVIKVNDGIFSTENIAENRDVTFGVFNLIATATFNLDTLNSHIIRFANSSAVSWTGNQLTINGWEGAYDGTSGTGGEIYFGSSASALTASQLEKIRFYDGTYFYNATLLSTGELVPAANAITTGSVATTICPGVGATSIPFTYTNEASFTVNTIFTVQLSDATGSFASPTTLGTVVGDASGSQSLSYNFTSSNISAGTGYRIRVVSNMPAVDGSNNGSDITFQQVNTYYADTDGDTYGNANADSLGCTAPVGYVTDNTDCIDASAAQNPGETEACNSFDDDCDGQIDEGVETIFYADADGDTFGDLAITSSACTVPVGYVSNSTDCNDASATVYPSASETCNSVDDDCDGTTDEGVQTTFYADADNDTYGYLSTTTSACIAPAGYVSNSTDCNDGSATVYPGATETCNSIDDDCDGTTDEGVQNTYYADVDNDTFGDLNVDSLACSAPAGFVSNSTDCNDASSTVYPSASEACNGVDDDCDGTTDEGVQNTYYADVDNDTFGNLNVDSLACSAPAGYVSNSSDCNDASLTVYPGATETCNSIDDDCDLTIDEGVLITYYSDADADGYGIMANDSLACSLPVGYAVQSGDCNDNNAAINPAATEICNDMDDDCDSNIDEGVLTTYYADGDGDGYGDLTVDSLACSLPVGYSNNGTDCNDASTAVNPGAVEVCNATDDDCDASTDEGVTTTYYADADNDSFGALNATQNACSVPVGYVTNSTDCNDGNGSVYPGALELCVNSIDDDCDGQINEGCLSSIPGDTPGDAIVVTPIAQFGTGAQAQIACNLLNSTNSVQTGSPGNDLWYTFVAQKNAVRIALKGSSVVLDDNKLMLYEDVADLNDLMIPIIEENDVTTGGLGASTDAGNETILYDQLVVGNTYYLCVKNVNATPGSCQLALAYLSGSESDNQIFTNYTNIFSSSCQNFKVRFRSNAKYYNVQRLVAGDINAAAEWIYAIPPGTGTVASTITQLGRIFPANMSNSNVTEYFKVDVYYELADAFGNIEPLWANGSVLSNIQLAPEAPVVVRAVDACPAFKYVSSSVITNRAVCGVSRYRWEWTMQFPTVGLPNEILGSVGGIRTLALNQVGGILNGQRYDVRIAMKHLDNATFTDYSSASCVKTIGAAGMPLVDNTDVTLPLERGHYLNLYPNPSNGNQVVLNLNDVEGKVEIQITDATGKVVLKNTYFSEGELKLNLELQDLADGLYNVEMKNGLVHESSRLIISK